MCPQVATLGEVMLRLSPPGTDLLAGTDSLDVHVAGSEANVAVALASLGVDAAFLSALPATPLGDRVAASLRAAGVDLDYLDAAAPGRLGLFFVEFGAAPRPTAVWYDRAGSAFSRAGGYDAMALDGARFAVVSGITPALSPATRGLATAFVAEARSRGVAVCIDVNYRERLWSSAVARECLGPLLGEAAIVVCSRRDAECVFELTAEHAGAVAGLLREKLAPSAELVVVTDGTAGCAAIDGSGAVFAQPAFAAEVVDRIGAGDAFLAGLLWGLLDDQETGEALACAAALGALKCTVRGDQARFGAEQLRAVVAGSATLIR
jgi:2-dehydro-3-deoxygluconokinase